jgi:hypothetical protein
MPRAEEQASDRSNEITTSSGPVDDVNRKPNEACGLVQCKDPMTGTVTGKGDKVKTWGVHTVRRRRTVPRIRRWPLSRTSSFFIHLKTFKYPSVSIPSRSIASISSPPNASQVCICPSQLGLGQPSIPFHRRRHRRRHRSSDVFTTKVFSSTVLGLWGLPHEKVGQLDRPTATPFVLIRGKTN